ncbi:MAG: aspartate aminotransferase family protein [Rhodospirillaceae bacterium]|nr:aspartate aminotransferase family protein [Rhodospirillaceae bacterium]|tara:strand:+ start:54575 stop:55951 length:1377 start_codon:yes stop_codon:yes gene_type:complete
MVTNPNSLTARDSAALLHPYTNALANEKDGSLVITSGRGVIVTDDSGREYIEGMSGLWCTALGFGNERLADAAARQIRELSFYHGFNQKSHTPQIKLAERLLALSPVPMSKVFFANSGSEANDTAFKFVWYRNNAMGKPEKKKIISREKGYHGVTIAAGSATGTPVNHQAFDLPIDRFLHTTCPHFVRDAKPGETEDQYAERCAQDLDTLIEQEGPETVAAFIAEPVMGAGGVLIPPAGYFERIQRVLKKHDVLMIADEVICGFGRTGNMWGSETFDIKPDIITCAKALSSGYIPISAVIMNEAVYEPIAEQSSEIGSLGHGFTYSGHPVAAAVALETLDIYEEMNLVQCVRGKSPHLQNGLRAFRDHPLVGEAGGVGLLGVIELVSDKKTGEAFPSALKVGPYLLDRTLDHGLIVRALGDRIAFSPPLVINQTEIEEMLRRFAAALEDTENWLKKAS